MAKRPQQINTVYQQDSRLSALMQRAQLLARLDHAFQQHLPAPFSAHCKLANIKGTTLVVHTDNASYSSLLRFQAPTLCRSLSQELAIDINTIEVKVRPHYRPFDSPSSHSINLPSSASTALQQTAETMEEGPLKQALQRLARRRKP